MSAAVSALLHGELLDVLGDLEEVVAGDAVAGDDQYCVVDSECVDGSGVALFV